MSTGDLTHVDELRRLGDRLVVFEEVEVEWSAVCILQLHSTVNTA